MGNAGILGGTRRRWDINNAHKTHTYKERDEFGLMSGQRSIAG
jgi:hypothetical protein